MHEHYLRGLVIELLSWNLKMAGYNPVGKEGCRTLKHGD